MLQPTFFNDPKSNRKQNEYITMINDRFATNLGLHTALHQEVNSRIPLIHLSPD